MFGLEFGERTAQCRGLVRADPLDEVDERRLATWGVGDLVKRVHHQTRDEFIAAVRGGVTVS
jgi:hypothetical protein